MSALGASRYPASASLKWGINYIPLALPDIVSATFNLCRRWVAGGTPVGPRRRNEGATQRRRRTRPLCQGADSLMRHD